MGGNISVDASLPSVEHRLLAAPIVSALAIVVSALAYPVVFPLLSQGNLVIGSFVGASLLLALPLIALSAMNPLLITLQRDQIKSRDAGAGRVFFISTMGSVVGVLFTTFMFIPNLTNFRAILVLGITICAITTVLIVVAGNLAPRSRHLLLASSIAVAFISTAILVGKSSYLELVSSAFSSNHRYTIKAEYTSMFGNIKVAEVTRDDDPDFYEKHFIQDGLTQNRTDANNKSISMYTYVLESLVHAYAPDAQDVLVLGLGAGVVPQHFRDDQKGVAVVEINSAAWTAASANFGFDQQGIRIHLEDARTYVRKCEQSYDAAVVDLFLGDGTPDYLMTEEFFQDLRNCLKPDGIMVMNAFLDDENDEPNMRMLATIAASFPRLYISGFLGGNTFIVGTPPVPAPDQIQVEANDLPAQIADMVTYSITVSQKIPREVLANTMPVTDDHNIFNVLFADANVAMRKLVSGRFPPHIMVN